MSRARIGKPLIRTAVLLSGMTGALSFAGYSAPAAAVESAPAAAAQTATDDRCAALSGVKLDQVTLESTATQPAHAPVAGAHMPGMDGTPDGGPPVAGLPAFCRVIGRIHPEPGSDIRFEVWMPTEGWNGRLNGVGTGGFAGSIDYMTLGAVLKAGQAGASTDTGHHGNAPDSSWAKGHPERVRDYGWRAIHLTNIAAKKLVAAFYNKGPDHSYFIGCSNGGRQG